MLKYLPIVLLIFACRQSDDKSKQTIDSTITAIDTISQQALINGHPEVKDSSKVYPESDFTINGLPLTGPYKLYEKKWGKPTGKSTEGYDMSCYDDKDFVIEKYKFKSIEFIGVQDTLEFYKCKVGAGAHFYFQGKELKTLQDFQSRVLDKSTKDSHQTIEKEKGVIQVNYCIFSCDKQLKFVFNQTKLVSVELWYECS